MKNLIAKIRTPKILRAIIAILLTIVIVFGFIFFEKTQGRVKIDDSLISAPVISIVPPTAGQVTEFDAVEGHKVSTGDLLAVVGGQAVRAQTDGLIIAANDMTGGVASPQSASPFIQIIKPQDLRVAGTLDENKGLNQVRVGQVASFTVDAISGQTFWGYVDEVAPTAKTTQAAFSISSERPVQQFVVYVKFDTTKYPQIKNGMSAKLIIFTKSN